MARWEIPLEASWYDIQSFGFRWRPPMADRPLITGPIAGGNERRLEDIVFRRDRSGIVLNIAPDTSTPFEQSGNLRLSSDFEQNGSITIRFTDLGGTAREWSVDMSGRDTNEPYRIDFTAGSAEDTAFVALAGERVGNSPRSGGWLPTTGTLAATLILDDGAGVPISGRADIAATSDAPTLEVTQAGDSIRFGGRTRSRDGIKWATTAKPTSHKWATAEKPTGHKWVTGSLLQLEWDEPTLNIPATLNTAVEQCFDLANGQVSNLLQFDVFLAQWSANVAIEEGIALTAGGVRLSGLRIDLVSFGTLFRITLTFSGSSFEPQFRNNGHITLSGNGKEFRFNPRFSGNTITYSEARNGDLQDFAASFSNFDTIRVCLHNGVVPAVEISGSTAIVAASKVPSLDIAEPVAVDVTASAARLTLSADTPTLTIDEPVAGEIVADRADFVLSADAPTLDVVQPTAVEILADRGDIALASDAPTLISTTAVAVPFAGRTALALAVDAPTLDVRAADTILPFGRADIALTSDLPALTAVAPAGVEIAGTADTRLASDAPTLTVDAPGAFAIAGRANVALAADAPTLTVDEPAAVAVAGRLDIAFSDRFRRGRFRVDEAVAVPIMADRADIALSTDPITLSVDQAGTVALAARVDVAATADAVSLDSAEPVAVSFAGQVDMAASAEAPTLSTTAATGVEFAGTAALMLAGDVPTLIVGEPAGVPFARRIGITASANAPTLTVEEPAAVAFAGQADIAASADAPTLTVDEPAAQAVAGRLIVAGTADVPTLTVEEPAAVPFANRLDASLTADPITLTDAAPTGLEVTGTADIAFSHRLRNNRFRIEEPDPVPLAGRADISATALAQPLTVDEPAAVAFAGRSTIVFASDAPTLDVATASGIEVIGRGDVPASAETALTVDNPAAVPIVADRGDFALSADAVILTVDEPVDVKAGGKADISATADAPALDIMATDLVRQCWTVGAGDSTVIVFGEIVSARWDRTVDLEDRYAAAGVSFVDAAIVTSQGNYELAIRLNMAGLTEDVTRGGGFSFRIGDGEILLAAVGSLDSRFQNSLTWVEQVGADGPLNRIVAGLQNAVGVAAEICVYINTAEFNVRGRATVALTSDAPSLDEQIIHGRADIAATVDPVTLDVIQPDAISLVTRSEIVFSSDAPTLTGTEPAGTEIAGRADLALTADTPTLEQIIGFGGRRQITLSVDPLTLDITGPLAGRLDIALQTDFLDLDIQGPQTEVGQFFVGTQPARLFIGNQPGRFA